MPEWVEVHEVLLAWLATLSVAALVGSAIFMPMLIVRIPERYFMGERRRPMPWGQLHPALRLVLIVLKNVAGWIFIVAGIAMLVLPGQGLLTIFAGLLLVDFPRKFKLLRWLVSHRLVLRSLNWIRRRAGRPPLQVPPHEHGHPPDAGGATDAATHADNASRDHDTRPGP